MTTPSENWAKEINHSFTKGHTQSTTKAGYFKYQTVEDLFVLVPILYLFDQLVFLWLDSWWGESLSHFPYSESFLHLCCNLGFDLICDQQSGHTVAHAMRFHHFNWIIFFIWFIPECFMSCKYLSHLKKILKNFLLKYSKHGILDWFEAYSVVIQHSYTLLYAHHSKCS